jgi:hypothetical protein
MNPTKFHKKLRLKKKIIAHLDYDEMMNAFGGKLVESIDFCPITWGGNCPTGVETEVGQYNCLALTL